MAYTCSDWYSTCDCQCPDHPENTNENTPLHSLEYDETNHSACCGYTCSRQCSRGTSVKPRPTQTTGLYAGATGQPVTWRKQSGDSAGKIFGLTTQQALIAVGVGVAAYFIIKKVK